MSRKIDRDVSDSLNKIAKYLIRTVVVLFIGWLSVDAFYFNGDCKICLC